MPRQIICSLICAVAFLGLAMSAGATPSPSKWRHITLLGVNDLHYYLLVTERTLPGSYFSFTDRWYLEIRRLDDRNVVERTLLRATSF